MASTIVQFDKPLDTERARYVARACGREREDGSWEGWIEFEDAATGTVVRTERETTQPNLADLKYWATGLSPIYLEGALARTLRRPAPVPSTPVAPLRFDGPADPPVRIDTTRESILDPFSVYEKNPDLLAQELTALRGWHLRQIIRDYHLVNEQDVLLENMTERELGTLIMQRVRALHG